MRHWMLGMCLKQLLALLTSFSQPFCKSTSFIQHIIAFTLIWELLLELHSNPRLNSLSHTHISHFNGAFDFHSSFPHLSSHCALYLVSFPISVCVFPTFHHYGNASKCHPASLPPFVRLAERLKKTIILESPDVGLHTDPH